VPQKVPTTFFDIIETDIGFCTGLLRIQYLRECLRARIELEPDVLADAARDWQGSISSDGPFLHKDLFAVLHAEHTLRGTCSGRGPGARIEPASQPPQGTNITNV